jgi:hypothetical protein
LEAGGETFWAIEKGGQAARFWLLPNGAASARMIILMAYGKAVKPPNRTNLQPDFIGLAFARTGNGKHV